MLHQMDPNGAWIGPGIRRCYSDLFGKSDLLSSFAAVWACQKGGSCTKRQRFAWSCRPKRPLQLPDARMCALILYIVLSGPIQHTWHINYFGSQTTSSTPPVLIVHDNSPWITMVKWWLSGIIWSAQKKMKKKIWSNSIASRVGLSSLSAERSESGRDTSKTNVKQ